MFTHFIFIKLEKIFFSVSSAKPGRARQSSASQPIFRLAQSSTKLSQSRGELSQAESSEDESSQAEVEPCGPSIANLYLAFFEIKYKKLLTTSLYYRFIDDILYCDSDSFLTDKFKEIFPDLKLNCVTSDTVQFLDLNISFNMDKTLNYDLYIKPTFTGSYLNINSNHPKHVFKGIVISQISRIRRNTTDKSNYLYHSTNILKHFLNKGFSYKLVSNIIRSFAIINRESLINYKIKVNNIFKNSLLFIFPHMYNFNFDNKYINTLRTNNVPNNSELSKYNL